ncbi:MAG: HAD hydrolase-like protein, partial [Paracoccaceae bacterium]
LDGRNSDKQALLAHGLAVVGAKGERAIMVGDRVYDIQGAQANGMKALGVSYGYGGLAELQEAVADATISDPQKLAETVSGLLPL